MASPSIDTSASSSTSSQLSPSLLSSSSSSLNDYPLSADGYAVYEEIGSGAFATVYRGVVKSTNEEVAMKLIDLDQFGQNFDEIRKEIMLMNLLSHQALVKIKCSFIAGQDLWIVMPYIQAGSCASIMKHIAPNGIKDEAAIATILNSIIQAIAYFHKDGKLHRDIKASNILMSRQGTVHLADFGVAGTLIEHGERKYNRQTFTGTPCWMAPEVMEHTNGYDEKADIWSFGITALELAYGRAPYARYPPMKVILLTLQDDPPTCEIYKDESYKFSKSFHALIKACLKKDPKERPTAKQLLDNKFFKQAKDAAYLVHTLIAKLPVKPLKNEPLDLNAIRNRPRKSQKDAKDAAAAGGGAGVNVDSWVFDESDADDLKRRISEIKEQNAAKLAAAAASGVKPQPLDDDDDIDDDETELAYPDPSEQTMNFNDLDPMFNAGNDQGSTTPTLEDGGATPIASPRGLNDGIDNNLPDFSLNVNHNAHSLDNGALFSGLGSASDAYAAMLAGDQPVTIENQRISLSSLDPLSNHSATPAFVPPLSYPSSPPSRPPSNIHDSLLDFLSTPAPTSPPVSVPLPDDKSFQTNNAIKNVQVKGRFVVADVHSQPVSPHNVDSHASNAGPSVADTSSRPPVLERPQSLPPAHQPTPIAVHTPGLFPDVFDSLLSAPITSPSNNNVSTGSSTPRTFLPVAATISPPLGSSSPTLPSLTQSGILSSFPPPSLPSTVVGPPPQGRVEVVGRFAIRDDH